MLFDFHLFRRIKSSRTMPGAKKRGVSVAEVVVAMAVIAIVSVAAITAVNSASNALIRDMSAVEIRTDASNDLEFFKFCDNVATLQAKILAYTGATVESNESLASGDRVLTLSSTVGYYTLKTEIVYTPDGDNPTDLTRTAPHNIRAYARDRDGQVLFDVGCEK